MRYMTRVALVGLTLAVQLLATGCLGLGGGGGSSSLGGSGSGSSGSGGSESFASLSSFSSVGGDSGSGGGGGGPVHNPEPASIALFGSGLIGLGVWSRRKTLKRSR